MKITDIDVPKNLFVFGAIHLLSNRFQTLGDKIDPSVSNKQWFVLMAVAKLKETSPNIGDIAKFLGTSRQNIKKMADALSRKGYLQLQKDTKDLRNIKVSLTEKCFDYFKSREQQENDYIEKIFSGIDDELLNSLQKGMSIMIENIDGMEKNIL